MTQDEIDARRYRWLRDVGIEADWCVSRDAPRGGKYQYRSDSLGAAIDAAMADEPRYTITAKGRAMLEGK
jgi:hypothetical protein